MHIFNQDPLAIYQRGVAKAARRRRIDPALIEPQYVADCHAQGLSPVQCVIGAGPHMLTPQQVAYAQVTGKGQCPNCQSQNVVIVDDPTSKTLGGAADAGCLIALCFFPAIIIWIVAAIAKSKRGDAGLRQCKACGHTWKLF